jgi:hypothetical protein
MSFMIHAPEHYNWLLQFLPCSLAKRPSLEMKTRPGILLSSISLKLANSRQLLIVKGPSWPNFIEHFATVIYTWDKLSSA